MLTVIISLSKETEERILDRAQATGKDIVTLAREAIDEKFAPTGVPHAPREGYERWSTEFRSWMADVEGRASMYPPGYTPDDSRESIYEGRGE